MMHETFVYICDPKDVSVLVRNEGKAPIRPHLDAIVEARNQEGLAVGITSHQGQFLVIVASISPLLYNVTLKETRNIHYVAIN